MGFTLPKAKEISDSEISVWVSNLRESMQKLKSGSLSVSFGKKAESLCYLDSIRIVYEAPARSGSARACKNALLDCMLSSERRIPGSSYFVLCGFILSFAHQGDSLLDVEKIGEQSRYMDIDELNQALCSISKCQITTAILRHSLLAAGSSGTIMIKQGDEFETRIKVREGYRFSAHIDRQFSNGTKINSVDLKDVDVISIDGVISTVSEIHHLLESYSERKRALCIFARGFEAEVTHTLAVNHLRGSLRVYPLRIPTSIETINLLRDVSVCVGYEPISSLKGELISSVDIAKIPSVNRLSVNDSSCTIENPGRSEAVAQHMKELIAQAAREQIEDKRALYEKRAADLNPAVVEVRLGRSLGEISGLVEDRIKSALGIINGFSVSGRIEPSAIDKGNFLAELLPNMKMIPAGSFINGISMGINLAESIKNSGAMITNDG